MDVDDTADGEKRLAKVSDLYSGAEVLELLVIWNVAAAQQLVKLLRGVTNSSGGAGFGDLARTNRRGNAALEIRSGTQVGFGSSWRARLYLGGIGGRVGRDVHSTDRAFTEAKCGAPGSLGADAEGIGSRESRRALPAGFTVVVRAMRGGRLAWDHAVVRVVDVEDESWVGQEATGRVG